MKTKEKISESEKIKELKNQLNSKKKELNQKNRELKIQAALEKVRAQTMAIQKSAELQKIVSEVFEQLNKLYFMLEGAAVFIGTNVDNFKGIDFWMEDKITQAVCFRLPYYDSPSINDIYEAKTQDKDFVVKVYGEEKNIWFDYAFKHTDLKVVPEDRKKWILEQTHLTQAVAIQKNSMIGVHVHHKRILTDIESDILKRFSKVFEQGYTRFLDLKKAEEQARDAQVEAALERIRARTMAMHYSEELADTVAHLFKQLDNLDIKTYRCNLSIVDPQNDQARLWSTTTEGKVIPHGNFIPLNENVHTKKMHEGWKRQDEPLIIKLIGEERLSWTQYIFKYFHYEEYKPKNINLDKIKAEPAILNCFFFSQGLFVIHTVQELDEKSIKIIQRFAKVFEQTYTRFLDLQNAEAAAREAEIEVALERIRARSMAMHKSNEIRDVASLLYKEIKPLVPDFNVVNIQLKQNSSKDIVCWIGVSGNLYPDLLYWPASELPVFETIDKAWKSSDGLVNEIYHRKEKDAFFKDLYNHMYIPDDRKKLIEECEGMSIMGWFNHYSGIDLMRYSLNPFNEEEIEIVKRFSTVFEQTYIRFLDLQKAEEQARMVVKQASLDRVRGEIASMRYAKDLNRITPVIWRELQALEIPFIRCGVFIINEETKKAQVYLTTPEGKALGVLNLLIESNEITKNTFKHWKKKHIYKAHWNKEEFINWTKSMMKIGQVQNVETYQGSASAPESLSLHFVPFKQGMLYVGNTSPLSEEELEMVQSLAKTFAIAYARYEDFGQLEEAKNQIEKTFTELKAAQSQLIQAEKMASLGELTAGIAHEIQNPLNFVNNFSEISSELIDEMHEELDKGDIVEAKAISTDIKQNLEKINLHGKRADAIVKGMLQHSQTSTGKKELTDINKLADEYLRLSYHGLRAKDKSFNADFKTEFDETLPKINVIPQDIGRVLLNLINNAFYAAPLPPKGGFRDPNYIHKPTVTVSTTSSKSPLGDLGVEIRVIDNGPGIPKKILDKIFQPFFTTKPTGQGTGLGLSLSYDIVKAHGGDLSVRTPLEKVETKPARAGSDGDGEGLPAGESGTEFIIHLPI